MEISLDMMLKYIAVAFLFIWGFYERYSAIVKDKKHETAENRDRYSLIILYITILTGYFIGVPAAFSPWGAISEFFPWVSISGFIIIAGGLAIRLTAIKSLANQFTYTVRIIDDHKLIVSGIYKYIRHPAYLGQLMVFLGSGLALGNWISTALLFLPSIISTLYRIRVEEKVLSEFFKDEYDVYMKNTKALIPLIY